MPRDSNITCGYLTYKRIAAKARLSTLPKNSLVVDTEATSALNMTKLISSLLITALVLPAALCCTLGSENGCSTGAANGLTAQLVAELNSMGVSFATLSDTDRFRCTSPCQPYLQTSARDALAAATLSKNDHITLNSAYRSSAQQYLLYRWYVSGLCGIGLAAKPGTSNHEGGLAIDTSFYDYWRTALAAKSWVWFGSGDPVHFTYTGAGAVAGVSKQSLLAFQRLWNRNNPSDPIADDGIYGTETATRLYRSPCSGW